MNVELGNVARFASGILAVAIAIPLAYRAFGPQKFCLEFCHSVAFPFFSQVYSCALRISCSDFSKSGIPVMIISSYRNGIFLILWSEMLYLIIIS